MPRKRTSPKKTKRSNTQASHKSGGTSSVSSEDYNDDIWTQKLGQGLDSHVHERQQHISRSTLYDEYKRATIGFKEGLASLVPSLGTKVQDLVVATDLLVKNRDARVSPSLLRTLRSAIRIRQRVALLYGDRGGDPGHEYFVKVLQYCYQSLKPLAGQPEASGDKSDSSAAVDSGDASVPLANKFQALSTDDDEDPHLDNDHEFDDEAGEEDWEEDTVERPEEPETDFFITGHLVEGSDCFFATSFLDTINTLLGEVAHAYATLKSICRQQRDSQEEKPLLGFELMKCAVVANAAVQELLYAEQVFIAERPYLSSVYHILAAAMYPNAMNLLVALMEVQDEDEDEKHRAATKYIGESMSHTFDETGKWRDKWAEASTSFSKRWLIRGWEASACAALVNMELEVDTGKTTPVFGDVLKRMGLLTSGAPTRKPNRLLSTMSNISGERSILQTLAILEEYKSRYGFEMFLEASFGWKEDMLGPPTTADLKSKFVLPVLAELCHTVASIFDHPITFEDKLFPILRTFRQYRSSEEAGNPVPLAFVFVIHMMQIAVIELHGENDLFRLSLAGKVTMSRYQKGVENANKSPAQFQSRLEEIVPPFWKAFLPNGVKLASAPGSEDVAFWNPCYAGMVILYCNMYQVEVGCVALDKFSQLKAMLHLSNAISKGGRSLPDSPVLSFLEKLFGKSKSIWAVRSRPSAGEFTKHFWLAVGMRLDTALLLSLNAARSWSTMDRDDLVGLNQAIPTDRRSECVNPKNRMMRAEEFSQIYRCLLLCDFGSTDRRNKSSCDWLGLFRDRVSKMLTSIDEEKDLLSHNLIYLGTDICGFPSQLINFDREPDTTEPLRTLRDADEAERAVAVVLSLLDYLSSMDDPRLDELLSTLSRLFASDRSLQNYEFFV